MKKIAIVLITILAVWQIWAKFGPDSHSNHASSVKVRAKAQLNDSVENQNSDSRDLYALTPPDFGATESGTTTSLDKMSPEELKIRETKYHQERLLNDLLREHEYTAEMADEMKKFMLPSGTEVERKWDDDQIEVIKERTDDGSTVEYRIHLDGSVESETFRRWTGEELIRNFDNEGKLSLILHRRDNGVAHVQEFFPSGKVKREVTEINGNVVTLQYDESGNIVMKHADIEGQFVNF